MKGNHSRRPGAGRPRILPPPLPPVDRARFCEMDGCTSPPIEKVFGHELCLAHTSLLYEQQLVAS